MENGKSSSSEGRPQNRLKLKCSKLEQIPETRLILMKSERYQHEKGHRKSPKAALASTEDTDHMLGSDTACHKSILRTNSEPVFSMQHVYTQDLTNCSLTAAKDSSKLQITMRWDSSRNQLLLNLCVYLCIMVTCQIHFCTAREAIVSFWLHFVVSFLASFLK